VNAAFDFVRPAYEHMARRLEAVENRMRSVLTLAAGILFAAPAFIAGISAARSAAVARLDAARVAAGTPTPTPSLTPPPVSLTQTLGANPNPFESPGLAWLYFALLLIAAMVFLSGYATRIRVRAVDPAWLHKNALNLKGAEFKKSMVEWAGEDFEINHQRLERAGKVVDLMSYLLMLEVGSLALWAVFG
jgi:hypothetical protein